MVDSDLIRVFGEIQLFHGLSEEEIALLAGSAKVRTYPPGAILFLEADEGKEAYVVISGVVDLTLMTIDGDQLLLHRVEGGGYFGEMALLDGKPRSATATIISRAEIASIARNDFLGVLRANPDAAILLLSLTFQRLRLADEKIKALGFQGVGGRLARTLLTLQDERGSAPVPIQHNELAQMIASRRPTISTLLSSWRAAGYIETSRGRLRVSDREALEALAEL